MTIDATTTVFLPPVDEPVSTTDYYPCAIDKVQMLEPQPPKPYDRFEDTYR